MIVQRALSEGPFMLKQLAEEAGLSYDALRSWATGRRTPQPESLRQLADGLRRRAEVLQELAGELEGAADA